MMILLLLACKLGWHRYEIVDISTLMNVTPNSPMDGKVMTTETLECEHCRKYKVKSYWN